eukprot:COSAG05_NODE_6183_length_1005_cov_2.288079_1_plen_86_part_00
MYATGSDDPLTFQSISSDTTEHSGSTHQVSRRAAAARTAYRTQGDQLYFSSSSTYTGKLPAIAGQCVFGDEWKMQLAGIDTDTYA